MRVLQVAPPWLSVPPRGYGGTESVIAELIDGLAAHGVEVSLFATGDSEDSRRNGWVYPEALGLRTFRPAAEVYQAVAAREVALTKDVDLIHDHTMAGAALPCLLPTVLTQHNRFTEESRPLYCLAQANGARVTAISRSHALEAGFEVDAIIHHGISLDRYAMGEGRGGYAVFLGRMSPDKGVHHAIELARIAGVPLRIAAKLQEPSEWQYFKEEIEPNLDGEVEFVGEVDFPTKVALLGEAMMLINPIQWSEPFGMIAVEAMACGTPVFTTPSGAAPEIVADGVTGFVRPLDELAEVLKNGPAIRRADCRAHVERYFSNARMAEDYVRLYRQVLS